MPKIVNGDPNVLDNGLTAAAYFCWVRWLARIASSETISLRRPFWTSMSILEWRADQYVIDINKDRW